MYSPLTEHSRHFFLTCQENKYILFCKLKESLFVSLLFQPYFDILLYLYVYAVFLKEINEIRTQF